MWVAAYERDAPASDARFIAMGQPGEETLEAAPVAAILSCARYHFFYALIIDDSALGARRNCNMSHCERLSVDSN
jgi:hypothetical protein